MGFLSFLPLLSAHTTSHVHRNYHLLFPSVPVLKAVGCSPFCPWFWRPSGQETQLDEKKSNQTKKIQTKTKQKKTSQKTPLFCLSCLLKSSLVPRAVTFLLLSNCLSNLMVKSVQETVCRSVLWHKEMKLCGADLTREPYLCCSSC